MTDRTRATQLQLRQCVRDMAAALARGEITPAPGELDALARVCELAGLVQEARRVRRWAEAPCR